RDRTAIDIAHAAGIAGDLDRDAVRPQGTDDAIALVGNRTTVIHCNAGACGFNTAVITVGDCAATMQPDAEVATFDAGAVTVGNFARSSGRVNSRATGGIDDGIVVDHRAAEGQLQTVTAGAAAANDTTTLVDHRAIAKQVGAGGSPFYNATTAVGNRNDCTSKKQTSTLRADDAATVVAHCDYIAA